MFHPLPLFIGLRYTRAKRRNHFISFISLISMLGIMLGIVALIVVLSVMNGFHKEIQERILGMASHATISAADPAGLTNWPELLAQVRGTPDVVGAAPFVEIEAMLMSNGQTNAAMLRGILPAEEDQVSDLREDMIAGRVENLIPGEFDIILGAELANILRVGLGDKVTVVTPQVNATPVGVMPRLKAFNIVGLFQVGMADYDRGMAFVHMVDAAKLMRLNEGAAGGIRLKLTDMFQAPRTAREVAATLEGYYRVTDWTQVHRNFFAALRTEKRMMAIILFLIVAVAAFNIVSTLVMVVTDKRGDIAVLRTLGASPGKVMAIFMVQGTSIGLVGTLFGVVGGVLLGWNVESIVATIEQMFGVHFLDPSIYYISALPSDVRFSDVVTIAGGAFAMSVLATLYPAWRASRTDPAEALRYE
ncbi:MULTISPECIES: lipoprotein-releasing ABC transporter permease subunit [Thiorhodovibrio]|uniref:lipoprotein-releasing ABC transporter permease subunit n=1 Tax=Thiorhodovibrio TaxID=61593 RepID=UPI001912C1BB|nr:MULTISPECIES: lipoprotein-releasing ABC transporter permease subunit [Thiorhodovibrio]MBK5969945.1 lipoprotein-releasing system transmembrane subunit LolC [Thiorhodovibrio winogradskyi]WPL12867.1 Lipoprotein-releasing system transmembrane protein LolE [Thiorhodovibrio litoralis]